MGEGDGGGTRRKRRKRRVRGLLCGFKLNFTQLPRSSLLLIPYRSRGAINVTGKSQVKRLYGQKETKRQRTAKGCEEEAVRYWER